jgi:tRNA (cmo5U34)-methyltransferase
MTTDWTFDGFGAEFDEHAQKHLPHYSTAHQVVCHAATYALHTGGVVADLGCSTGHAIEAIAGHIPGRPFTAHGYDADQSMLDHAAIRLGGNSHVECKFSRVDLTCDPLEHEEADVTLALWTLQFLPPSTWVPLLRAAHDAASADGLLLIGAKTRLSDARWQESADGALADWKDQHGVTPEEALAKSRSLRGTMSVVSTGRLFDVVEAAGWHSSAILFRWNAWVVLGAWASPLTE